MPLSKPQKMADPPDSPTLRRRCLRYPPGESKLELMPTELLEQIFEQLSQNDLQSRDDLHDADITKANRRAHTNMRSLCRTSKRVDAVARRLLFCNITVTSNKTLLSLYETLLSNAQLGCYVRQISFEIFSEAAFLPLHYPVCQRLLTAWDEDIAKCRPEDSSVDRCEQFMSYCYFEILRRTPRAHRLVIRIQPISRPHLGLDGPTAMYTYRPFFKRVRHAVQASLTGQGSEFLPRLTTLQLLGDPYDPTNLFDITICEPLLRIHTLRTIKTFRCNEFWSGLEPVTSGPASSG